MPSFLSTVWYVLLVSYLTISLDVSLFTNAAQITTASFLTDEDGPRPSLSAAVAKGSIVRTADSRTPSSSESAEGATPVESSPLFSLSSLPLLSRPPAPLASNVYYVPPGYHVKIVKDDASSNGPDGPPAQKEEDLLEEEYNESDEEHDDDDESKEQRISNYEEAWIKSKRATLTNRHADANASEFKAKREDEHKREPLAPPEKDILSVVSEEEMEERPLEDAKVLRDATFPPAPTFALLAVSSRDPKEELSSNEMQKQEEEQSTQTQSGGAHDMGMSVAYVTAKLKGVMSTEASVTNVIDQQSTTTTVVSKVVKKKSLPASFDDLYVIREEEKSKKRQRHSKDQNQSATSGKQERLFPTLIARDRQQDPKQQKGHVQQRPMANGADTSFPSAYSFGSGLLSGGLASPQAFLMLLVLIVFVSAVVVYARNLALERLGLLHRKKEGKSRGGVVSKRRLASTAAAAAGGEGIYEELASEAEPKNGQTLHV